MDQEFHLIRADAYEKYRWHYTCGHIQQLARSESEYI